MVFITSFLFQNCSENINLKKENPSNLFESCMETFSDEIKCREMQEKSERKSVSLSNTEQGNIFIRQELIDLLELKSKLYVLELLGEPDDKNIDGSGKEYFLYTRPLTKYSQKSIPDKQLIIIFRKGHVTKVLHK